QQPSLWFHGGNLQQNRHYSQFRSLQLKARMEGIPTPVYGLAPVYNASSLISAVPAQAGPRPLRVTRDRGVHLDAIAGSRRDAVLLLERLQRPADCFARTPGHLQIGRAAC